MILELDVIHVKRYLVSALTDVLPAVDEALAPFCLFEQGYGSEDRCTVLLRPDMEILPLECSDDLEILDQPVAL